MGIEYRAPTKKVKHVRHYLTVNRYAIALSAMHTGKPDWHTRLKNIMPWGSSTCSKMPTLLPDEPQVIVRGKGCRVWDDRGREFIDYRNSLGPVTLGYQYPAVDEAIIKQLKSGIIFGHAHPLECEVAELLCEVIPCAQQARFLKTGGEAVAATIKAARSYTGRDHIIQIGYNGWINSLSTASSVLPGQQAVDIPPGVPAALAALHHSAAWNDTKSIEQLFDQFDGQIAALVVSASYPDMQLGETFYPFLRKITQKHAAVLIFDEIVTGFRIAIGGAQEYFNVTPDMAVFAKAIANGMPLSAYVGSKELMGTLDQAIVSSTYGGEALSLAACKAAIHTYRNEQVIDHLWQQGEKLWTQVNDLGKQHNLPIRLTGMWPCPQWQCDDDSLREPFFRAAYRHGVSLFGVSYINFSHMDNDVAETLERLDRAMKEAVAI